MSEIEVVFENSNERNELITKINEEIIKNGFKKTAIKYSTSSTAMTGGSLGWINSNQLSREIFNIVNNLQKGQVSKPLKKGNTLTFLKMNEKKVSESKVNSNIKILKQNLEKNKRNELLNLYSSSHLSKIKNTTLIEFFVMRKIVIIAGDPNSVNSELIIKAWNSLRIQIKKNLYNW